MFENNGFAFDSAGSFFGESTTPSFENGFSNAGPSDGFFSESAFDENGFSTSETSVFGESASYCGGFTQFGSVFSESAFGEDGFSTDGMFCESKYTRQTGEQWENYYANKNGSSAKGNNMPKKSYTPSEGELDPLDDAGERSRWDRKRTEIDNYTTKMKKIGYDDSAEASEKKKQEAAKQHEATMAKIQARRDRAGEIGEANIKNNNPLHAKVRKIQK